MTGADHAYVPILVEDEKPKNELPIYSAPLFSRLTWSWITPLLNKGKKQALEAKDLWQLPPQLQCAQVTIVLEENYNALAHPNHQIPDRLGYGQEAMTENAPLLQDIEHGHKKSRMKSKNNLHLFWAICQTFKPQLLFMFVCMLLHRFGYVVAPFITGHIVKKVGQSSTSNNAISIINLLWAFPLPLFLFLTGYCFLQAFTTLGYFSNTLNGALISMVTKKAMCLSRKARLIHTNGMIHTMIAADCLAVGRGIDALVDVVLLPPAIIVGLVFIFLTLGYSAAAGVLILACTVPLQRWMISKQMQNQENCRKATDKRVNMLSEVLKHFQAVKFGALETIFGQKIQKYRKMEIQSHQAFFTVLVASRAMMLAAPLIATTASLITYSITGHDLKPSTVFAALHHYTVISLHLTFLPNAVSYLIAGKVAYDRIAALLKAEEIDTLTYSRTEDNLAVRVKASFAYDQNYKETLPLEDTSAFLYSTNKLPQAPFSLQNIDIAIKKVGRVGTGKTSFLLALNNSLRKIHGRLSINGSISYVPQGAWVHSGSIKSNITFSSNENNVDSKLLQEAIYASGLSTDIKQWPNGADTLIGERGITVSGGQRQRICLARAAYAQSDIVLLDDPLSAVDAHVGHHILENCILNGPFAGSTRILVTHHMEVLSKADWVVVMDRDFDGNGYIKHAGDFQTILSLLPDLQNVMQQQQDNNLSQIKGSEPADSNDNEEMFISTKTKFSPAEDKDIEDHELDEVFMKEDQATGTIKNHIYSDYLKAVKSSFLVVVIAGTFLLKVTSMLYNFIFIGQWSSDNLGLTQHQYIALYSTIGVIFAVSTWYNLSAVCQATLRASANLFDKALHGVFQSSLNWHIRNPTGRIISRLSTDIDVLDSTLGPDLFETLSNALSVLAMYGLAIYLYPIIACVLIPYTAWVIYLAGYYRHSAREIKRTQATLRSNIVSTFAEQLAGIDVVRTFKQEGRCLTAIQAAMDRENQAAMLPASMLSWLSLRVDGAIVIFAVCLFGLLNNTVVDAASFGAILTLTIQTISNTGWMATKVSELESEMNTVERVLHYSKLAPEGDLTTSTDPLPHQEWPKYGNIVFDKVSLQYGPNLPMVLKNVSFQVRPGEKIGIIGRTGAGKSTILQALFRTTELAGGKILVDGVDTTTLALQTLRQRLSIIPQEAFLFSGTVQENLDPEGKATHQELEGVLQLIQKSPNISTALKQKLQLEAEVEAEGANFSAGERQLLALLRALVKRSKVLVMDEATSSVDLETDALIQRIIQAELGDVTLLCIAHRLQTVAFYDRLIVMDGGRIVEMDTPMTLFDRPDSVFRQMCDQKQISREALHRIRAEASN